MVGGESASVGIVFYDTEKKNENADDDRRNDQYCFAAGGFFIVSHK